MRPKAEGQFRDSFVEYLYDLPEIITHASTFSDTWRRQDRNKFALLHSVNKMEVIDVKFMQTGHFCLKVDFIHATKV